MKLNSLDRAYLDGLLDAFEDFSDGAWQTACVEAIRCEPRFRGRDPHEVWLAWCMGKEARL